jgi:hypothetical protein
MPFLPMGYSLLGRIAYMDLPLFARANLFDGRKNPTAGIYPYMDSSRPTSRTCMMREG